MFVLVLKFYVSLNNLFRKVIEFDFNRIKTATSFSLKEAKMGYLEKSFELVYVATKKDFDTLKMSLKWATKSLSNYNVTKVRVIVPDHQTDECKEVLNNLQLKHLEVIPETSLINNQLIETLNSTFAERGTWVLQQLLKVQAVSSSKASAVLIVDADTIILRKRAWFDHDGRQLLTPSIEYHKPYYFFLNKIFGTPVNPRYTFISHHMVMQPNLLRTFLQKANFLDINNFVKYIIDNADRHEKSAVCLEYELYGQNLIKDCPNFYWLGRWSNISLSRLHFARLRKHNWLIKILAVLFNSVSFHSWSLKAD